MTKLVLYSGGMDSFTLLNDLVARCGASDIQAISFDYGQRHKKELEYARVVTQELGIPHRIINLQFMRDLLKGSALTDNSVQVPEGHYQAPTMTLTVVPGRNTLMLSIAMAIAEAESIERVYYAAHSGDHAIYPDCRPEYVKAMASVFFEATGGRVTLGVPFLTMDKTDILRAGLEMGLDYGKSWTCYKGEEKPCGKCGACMERAEAFRLNNAVDPAYA